MNSSSVGKQIDSLVNNNSSSHNNIYNRAQEKLEIERQKYMSDTFNRLLKRKHQCIVKLSQSKWTKLVEDINAKVGWDMKPTDSRDAANQIASLLHALFYQRLHNQGAQKTLPASTLREIYNLYDTIVCLVREAIFRPPTASSSNKEGDEGDEEVAPPPRKKARTNGDADSHHDRLSAIVSSASVADARMVQHRHLGKKQSKNSILASLTLPSLPVLLSSSSMSAPSFDTNCRGVSSSSRFQGSAPAVNTAAPSTTTFACTESSSSAPALLADTTTQPATAFAKSTLVAPVSTNPSKGTINRTSGSALNTANKPNSDTGSSASILANGGGSSVSSTTVAVSRVHLGRGGSAAAAPTVTKNLPRKSPANITNSLVQASKATRDVSLSANQTLDDHIGPYGWRNKFGEPNRGTNKINGQHSNVGRGQKGGIPPPPRYQRLSLELQPEHSLSSTYTSMAAERAPEPSFAAIGAEKQQQQQHEKKEPRPQSEKPRTNGSVSPSFNVGCVPTRTNGGSGESNRGGGVAPTLNDGGVSAASSTLPSNDISATQADRSSSTAVAGQMAPKASLLPSTTANGSGYHPRLTPSNQASEPALAPTPKWTRELETRTVKFEADPTGKYGHFHDWRSKKQQQRYHVRPAVEVEFRKLKTTTKGGDIIHRRLERWEAYWPVVETGRKEDLTEWRGLTSPIDKVIFIQPDKQDGSMAFASYPHTVASCEIPNLIGMLAKLADLKKLKTLSSLEEAKEDGEIRVLLEMIPFERDSEQKLERADTHLWPKGTTLFFQAGHPGSTKKPILLRQRKQANHKLTEWSCMSHILDLTPHLVESIEWSERNGGQRALKNVKTSFDLLCHDKQIFGFRVAICSYRSPEMLSRMFKAKIQKRKTASRDSCFGESLQKARQIMRDSHVLIDDAEFDDTLQHLTFKLFDEGITRKPIKNPVRGKACIHVTCFNLDEFLILNKRVSGTRYCCPVCTAVFVSPLDLEFCVVSEKALEQFSGDIYEDRHDVKLSLLDGTMELLEVEQRQTKKEKKSKVETEVEIIEIDD